ncbi:MAG: hypothetical protein ACYDD1_16175, partial [Caulobacteraceae bacterium]
MLADYAASCDEVYPTVAKLAELAGVGESTAHEAKERLFLLGLIQWVHRAVEVDDPQPGEPPVRQTSNL